MTAPAFAEAVSGELGEYDVSNFERWSLFAPRRGQVITTELPDRGGFRGFVAGAGSRWQFDSACKSPGEHQPRGHELVVGQFQSTGWQRSHLLECWSVPGRRIGVPYPQVGAMGWKHLPVNMAQQPGAQAQAIQTWHSNLHR